MSALAGEQPGIKHLRDLFEVTRPVLQQFNLIAKLQYRNLILTIESRHQVLSNLAGDSDVLGLIYFTTRIQQQHNVRGNMTDASDLLRYAVFQDQQVVNYQARIEMTVLVISRHRQLHLFSYDAEPFLRP